MYLGYIDDSGTFDKKKQSFEVLATLLVHDKIFSEIKGAVGLCVENVILKEKLEKFEEFHACELYGGYGVFDGIDQQTRFAAIRQLLSIIKDFRLHVIYGAVNLRQLQHEAYGSAVPADVAFRLCLSGIIEFMDKEQRKGTLPECVLLIADDTDKKKRELIKNTFRWVKNYVFDFLGEWRPGKFFHDDMYFGSSKDSVGIQLADLCAYFVAKHLENNDPEAESFYQIFSELIVHSEIAP
jgi:hypothetical protein